MWLCAPRQSCRRPTRPARPAPPARRRARCPRCNAAAARRARRPASAAEAACLPSHSQKRHAAHRRVRRTDRNGQVAQVARRDECIQQTCMSRAGLACLAVSSAAREKSPRPCVTGGFGLWRTAGKVLLGLDEAHGRDEAFVVRERAHRRVRRVPLRPRPRHGRPLVPRKERSGQTEKRHKRTTDVPPDLSIKAPKTQTARHRMLASTDSKSEIHGHDKKCP